jgi:hypothetical protein
MPKLDAESIAHAASESGPSLVTATLFFGYNIDNAINLFSIIRPVFIGLSGYGLGFGAALASLAAYGAYVCHSEIDKSNQPNVSPLPQQLQPAPATIELVPHNNELKEKSPEEMIAIIEKSSKQNKKLKRRLKKAKQQLQNAQEEEDNETKYENVPLFFHQKAGIFCEYISHTAGLAGFALSTAKLAALYAGTGLSFGAELGIQLGGAAFGWYSAKADARSARKSMQKNNYHESELIKHSLFKAKNDRIEVRVEPVTVPATPSNATDYHELKL